MESRSAHQAATVFRTFREVASKLLHRPQLGKLPLEQFGVKNQQMFLTRVFEKGVSRDLLDTSAGVKSATGNLSDYKRRMALAIRIIVMGANGVET